MDRRRCTFVVAALTILVGVAQLFPTAGADDGVIQVVVYEVKANNTRAPLAGATVTLQEGESKIPERSLTTNERGQSTFGPVPPGAAYIITVTHPGHMKLTKQAIRVVKGVTTQVVIGILPDLSEEVVVVERKRMVELAAEAHGKTAISAEAFEDLPVLGRDYQNVLTLAPGVQDADSDGNPNVHGSREQDFRMTVDGVSNVDPLTGLYMSSVNPDSIEEIEIIESGADASFGGAIGGYGRIITKSGGNRFEGAFNLLLADSMFDNDGAGAGEPLDYSRFQPALYFSGPIVRDKAWFALQHEMIEIDDPITSVNAPGVVQTIDAWRHADKVTWQITPKNKVQLEWRSDPQKIEPAGVNTLTPPDSAHILQRGGPTTSFKWIAPFSPTFFWEATVGFSDTGLDMNPYNPGAKNNCVAAQADVDGDGVIDIHNPWSFLNEYYCTDNIWSGRHSGAFSADYHDARQRWTYQLDAEQFVERWLGARHRLKAGVGLERVRFERDLTIRPVLDLRVDPARGPMFRPDVTSGPEDPGGWIPGEGEGNTEDSLFFLLNSIASYFPGQSPVTVENMLRPQRGLDTSLGAYYSAYINDSFEPRSNLSISVGLRYSREELQSDGYKFFEPASERALYDATVLERLQRCYQELDCGSSPSTTCYETCLYREAIESLGLLTVHPIDDPTLLLPRDENGEIIPGAVPQCNRAVNVKNCESLWIVKNTSDYVTNGRLAVRTSETFNIANNSFAPRVGVNWDPGNDARTKLFASWGRYFGSTFLAPLVDENGPDTVLSTYGLNRWRAPIDGGQGPAPQSLVDSAFTVRMIDRDLQQQRNDEWSVGVEREIAQETAVKLRYVNRRYRDQLQDVDLNKRAITTEEMRNRPEGIFPVDNPDGSPADCPMVKGFYDCTGRFTREMNSQPGYPGLNPLIGQPDGTPDLVALNPLFNSVLLVGNFSASKYEAYILELNRRYFRHWELSASYTYSRTHSQAEEYASTGLSDPTVADDEEGPLSFDQPHVVKLHGRMFVPKLGGFRVGGALTYESGLPYSIVEIRPVVDFPTDLTAGEAGRLNLPDDASQTGLVSYRTLYPTGQRNDQRNPSFWTVNVNLQKEFLIKDVKGSLQVEVFNLLNDDTQRTIQIRRVFMGESAKTPVYHDVPIAFRRFGRQFQVSLRVNF